VSYELLPQTAINVIASIKTSACRFRDEAVLQYVHAVEKRHRF